MLKETTVAITIILALLQVNQCAVPIEIVELPIIKKKGGTIDLMIPNKDPIISRRQRYYQNYPYYFYDYPLKYYDEKWVDDDYMPFLTGKTKYQPPKLKRGPRPPVFLAQVIPILKSMILGTGINQGPGVRIHRNDLWLWNPWRWR